MRTSLYEMGSNTRLNGVKVMLHGTIRNDDF